MKTWILLVVLLGMLVGLPLLGVWLAGKKVGAYLEFPPVTHYVEHAGFSWAAFLALAVPAALAAGALLIHFATVWRATPRLAPARPFPWWGWAGVAWLVGAWLLAWTRLHWAAPLQRFTFTPLWLGYIVITNALCQRQTGQCMLLSRPRYFLLLFPASAGFWWFFEYLNRFVQNWYYVGVEGLSPLRYFWEATIPFATVLPAVLGTAEWLRAVFPYAPPPTPPAPATPRPTIRTPLAILLLAAGALLGLGSHPDVLFPLVWIAPCILITGIRQLAGQATILKPWTSATRHQLAVYALAALVCGFFWEMWNYYSLAKWIYAVPYVGRFPLFEMPLLGYTGYLPFGLECAALGQLLGRPPRPSNECHEDF